MKITKEGIFLTGLVVAASVGAMLLASPGADERPSEPSVFSYSVPIWVLLLAVFWIGGLCYFIAWGIHSKWNNMTIEDLRAELHRQVHYQEQEAIERRTAARMAARRSRTAPRAGEGEGITVRKLTVRGSTREDGRD